MKTLMVKAAAMILGCTLSGSLLASAQSLDELLQQVEKGRVAEASDNRAREQRFLAERNNQQAELNSAKKLLKQKEQEAARLEKQFEGNERLIADKQKQLKERMGNLTELFGHLTATTGDLRSNLESSIASAQYPNREVFLDGLIEKMSGAEQLPSIEEIEKLWFELQREMTESGRIVTFDTTVVKPGGEKSQDSVTRIGAFNLISSDGQYLQFSNGTVSELARQPSGPYLQWSKTLVSAQSGFSPLGVDPTGPTGGSYLAALIDSPNLVERWHQGGVIGYIITGIGAFAMLVAVWRLLALSFVGARVRSQLKNQKANENNPLGRVLKVHEDNPALDAETLELKLSEAVIREVPKLENGLNLLKIISAVAPLMGLLGTVTGMIITFQAITIFGAGDPKAMAGGISGALVTTVLGLVVAIPTVLMHTLVNNRAKALTNILVEQSTGIIAQRTEQQVSAQSSASAASTTKPAARVTELEGA